MNSSGFGLIEDESTPEAGSRKTSPLEDGSEAWKIDSYDRRKTGELVREGEEG